ncbi:hypothetical protein ACQR1I_35390 [Bradyrhizobium sp. HKCCYLS2038]|uniref:hypothetical protein n=1 Tax=unclassified Bradyrhizobium TaxID=2631580 RepID=UPI003EB99874
MTAPALSKIVLDFEAAALRAVATGGTASDIERAHEAAIERLRDIKASCEAEGQLAPFYLAVLELETKLKMAVEAVGAVKR